MIKMNGIYGLILILFFFAITPNLGFFTLLSFLLLSLIFVFLILNNESHSSGKPLTIEICFTLLFYACFYYGGLYQNKVSIFIGIMLFFTFVAFLFFNHYAWKNRFNIFPIILVFYLFLGMWTLWGSPKPIVDTFDVFSQVGQKFLAFQNPYTAVFTRTYTQIDNHFHYLPFSFLSTSPFSILFHDPRYTIIFFNILSVVLLKKLFKDKIESHHLDMLLATFLFLPRSFYMLEHMYLDPIIFSFFLLFYYCFQKRKYTLSIFLLALFFSFKQNLLILLPLFVFDKNVRVALKRKFIFFLVPFSLIVFYFFLSPRPFLSNTFFSMFGAVFYPQAVRSTPTDMALSIQVFIKQFAPHIKTVYLYGISGLALLAVSVRIIFLRSSNIVMKVFLMTFAMGYFMHLSFFNQYYFVALFYFFALMLEQSSSQKIPKPLSKTL